MLKKHVHLDTGATLTTETTGELEILRLTVKDVNEKCKKRARMNPHRYTLSVDGSQVGVFEEGDEVSLSGLLKRHDGRGLEAEIGLQKM